MGPGGIYGLPQLLLLRVKNGFLWCFALLNQQGIFFVQLGLPTLLSVVLPVSDLLLSAGQEVNLVQPTFLTHCHDLLPQVTHELSRTAVLGTCPAVAGTVHVGLALHVLNPKGVDDDVTMQIPGPVMSIWVRAHQRLMTQEVIAAKLLAHLLDFLQGEAVIFPVPWVERDDVVMGLDVALFLILLVPQIGLQAFHGEAVRGAEYTGNQILRPGDVVPMLVK